MAPDETDSMKVKDIFETTSALEGRTEVESSVRSAGDLPVGGITEWDDTFATIPVGFVLCNGATINDPLSAYNGSAVPDLNTNYWSCRGVNFQPEQPDIDNHQYPLDGTSLINTGAPGDGYNTSSMIDLPKGAVITGAVVYGNDTGNTWTLRRITTSSSGTQTTMATAVIGTEDTTISDATIDTETYGYALGITGVGSADRIYGARISYTPRFKFIIRIK